MRRGALCYTAAEGDVLAFTRTWEEDTVLCACNAGAQPAACLLDFPAAVLLGDCTVEEGEEGYALTLPPRSAAVLLRSETPCAPMGATAD